MEKVNKIFNELYNLNVMSGRLGWTLYTTGLDFGVMDNQKRISKLLQNKSYFKKLKTRLNRTSNPKDKRKLEIMHNLFKPYHLTPELNEIQLKINELENELSQLLNSFRYTLDGKTVSSVELNQIISLNDNREKRKAAFNCYTQINKPLVDNGFIKLVELRKKYAQKANYENYVKYKLAENELPDKLFDNWREDFHKILPRIKKMRQAYALKYLDDDKIYPWDTSYIMGKIAPLWNSTVDMSNYYQVLCDFFKLFNIDLTKYNITYDIFSRANKSEWGYNFPIETAKDTRILANVKNKFYEYNVLLHETGHAVHSCLLDPDDKIINYGLSGIVCEGIANLFQTFIYNKDFYQRFFNNDVSEQFEELQQFKKINTLNALNDIFFEHRLYQKNISSLDDIYLLYHENYQELYGEDFSDKEVPWANRIHFTTHPIYLHNYLMGDVLCEAIFKIYHDKFGVQFDYQRFADFVIKEVIAPSGMYKFNDLFYRLSGNDFSLNYLF